MSYTYDSLNRLSSVTDRLGTSNYTYDGASNVSTVTYPNGVEGTYMYDALNRVTGLGYSNQSSSYVYVRDNDGRLTSATEPTSASEPNGRQVSWSFDGISRLQTETISNTVQNNGSVSYTLDPVGNRLSDTSSLAGVPSGSWNYNSDDELSDETYDQDGNVTQLGANQFNYDSQNELVAMNGTAVGIEYDGDGNRVLKTVTSGSGTTTTQFLVDDLNPTGYPQVMDELTNGVVTRTYTYGLQRISEDQQVNGAWTPSFYSYDGMGSVRQLTNMTGAVTDTYEYDAYGNHWTAEGSTPNNMFYRGEEYDSDLSLVYLRARYMNPLTGRFLSRDPEDGDLTNPKTLHKYLYADGDPVDLSDPTGRATAALPMPGRATAGGDLGEYALVVLAVGLGTVAADKEVACALNTAYDTLALSIGSVSSGGLPAIPEPDKCKAKCAPCDPPSGTQCYETHSGHTHNGWDPHSHIWTQNQNPNTCKCFWNRGGGTGGATQFPPAGMSDCSSYPSWPAN